MGADLSLNVNQAGEADGQHHLVEHEGAQGLDALLRAVLVLVPDEEVDEDVEELSRDDDDDCITERVRM